MVDTCNRRTTQSGGLHRRSQCRGVGHSGSTWLSCSTLAGMATGTTRDDGSRRATRVSAADLPRGGGHPFHEWLNRILGAAGFDAFVDGPCARRVHRWPLEMACNAMLCTFVATVLSLAMERTLAPGYFVVGYSIGFCVQICNSVGRTCSLLRRSSVTGYSGRFRPCHRGEMERTFGKLRHDAVAPAQFCRSGGTGFLPVWRGGARCSGRAFSPGRRRGVLVGAAAKSGCGVGPGGCGRPGVEMAESEPGGAVPRVSVRGRGPRGVRAARMRGPAPPAVRRAAAGRGLRGRRVRGRAASW